MILAANEDVGVGMVLGPLTLVLLVLLYVALSVVVTRVRRRRQARWLDRS